MSYFLLIIIIILAVSNTILAVKYRMLFKRYAKAIIQNHHFEQQIIELKTKRGIG